MTEASIGYYSYANSRADVAGDVWVAGANCWATTGYSIGSPVLNSCSNIAANGDITMPYIVKTSEIMVDIIRGLTAEHLTVDDNVIISGNLDVTGNFKYSAGNVACTTPLNNNLAQICLNGVIGNYIGFNQNGVSSPTSGIRSVGTEILLYSPVATGTADVDYAIGTAASTLWHSIPNIACSFKWFIGVANNSVLTMLGLLVNNQKYRYHNVVTALNSPQVLTTAQMLTNIIVCTSSAVVTFTLPTGSNIHSGMIGVTPLNQGFEWSIINIGSVAGAVLISSTGSTNHTYLGNAAIIVNKSARFGYKNRKC